MTTDSNAPSAAEILGLPGAITGPAELDRWGRLVLPLRLDACPDVQAGGRRCPACRGRRPAVGTYGHFPLAGRPCRVRLSVASCPRGALPAPAHATFLDDWGITTALFEQLAVQICAEPLAKVAQQTGLAPAKLGHLLMALEAEVAARCRGRAPRYLGLDGVHILGHTRTNLTDLGADGRLVELAEKHSPAAIRAALRRLEGADRVAIVVIDMCAKLRAAVTEVLPQAEIRLDTVHVGRRFSDCLSEARRRLAPHEPVRLVSPQPGARRREVLTRLLRNNPRGLTAAASRRLAAVFATAPLLAEAHALHDQLWRLLKAPNRRSAEQQAAAFVAAVPPELAGAFRPAVALLTGSWAPLFFANFTGPRLTNNRTEALNRRIEEIWEEGRGNTRFAALRLKCLARIGPLGADTLTVAARTIAARSQPGIPAEATA